MHSWSQQLSFKWTTPYVWFSKKPLSKQRRGRVDWINDSKNKHHKSYLYYLAYTHSITFHFYIITYSAFTEQRYYMLWQNCFILFKKWHASMGKHQKSRRRRFFIITDMLVCRKLVRGHYQPEHKYMLPDRSPFQELVRFWLMLYNSTAFYMLYIFRRVLHLGQDFIVALARWH